MREQNPSFHISINIFYTGFIHSPAVMLHIHILEQLGCLDYIDSVPADLCA